MMDGPEAMTELNFGKNITHNKLYCSYPNHTLWTPYEFGTG